MTNEQLLKLLKDSRRAIGMTAQDEFDLINEIRSGNNFVYNPNGDELLDLLKNVDSSSGGVTIPNQPVAPTNILTEPASRLDDLLAKAPESIARNKAAISANKLQLPSNIINDPSIGELNALNQKGGFNYTNSNQITNVPPMTPPPVTPANNILSSADDLMLPAVIPQAAGGGAAGAAGAAGKAGLFQNLKAAGGKALGTLGKGLNALNKAAPVIGGVTQGIDSAFALGDLANTSGDVGELERLILSEAAGAKDYSGLSVDDERMIQGMRRGIKPYNKGKLAEFLKGGGKGLGGAAITGALGLVPGMQFLLPIAAAQLATSGVRGITESKQKDIADLQGLYQRLQQNKGRIA